MVDWLTVEKLTGFCCEHVDRFNPSTPQLLYVLPLMLKEPFLAPQTAAIAAECPVSTNDSVARDDDAEHVFAVGAADGAAHFLVAELLRHPGVGTGFA